MKAIQVLLSLTTVIAFGACNLLTSSDKKFDTIDQVPLIPRRVLFNNPENNGNG